MRAGPDTWEAAEIALRDQAGDDDVAVSVLQVLRARGWQPPSAPSADAAEPKKVLVLHVEVPGFYADDLDELAGYCSEPDEPTAEDRLYVVREEWMRYEVGVTLVSRPGDKCMNDDFEVHAYVGRIVGAEARRRA